MAVVQAMGMRAVGQHLDHPALANLPAAALLYHPLELGLECRELLDPALDGLELASCDGIGSIARPIGNVSRIAQVYTSCGGGYVWCRYADVALIAVRDTIPIGWATAAISTATTPPANPSYLGWRAYAGSGVTGAVLGETITRVGRTRGQTTGTVVVSCQDRQSTLLPGMWTLCAMNATATTEGGDSGGTVYIPSTVGQPTTPRAVGTLFQGGVGSTWFSSAGFVNLALGNDVYFVW